MTEKPRLLVPILVQFSVRYLLRTGLLAKLAQTMQPVILLGWEDQALQSELEQIGAEVYLLPKSEFGLQYYRLKARIDIWFKDHLMSPSTSIDKRRNNLDISTIKRAYRTTRDIYFRYSNAVLGGFSTLKSKYKSAIFADTNIATFQQLLDTIRPDLLLSLTPFFTNEHLLLNAAESQQIPMITAIASFDNLTTRGWIPVIFDTYLLWNKYNVAELKRAYPEAENKPVTIVGAPQFDFYWQPKYLLSEQDWRRLVRVDTDRPIILFGGASRFIAEPETEIVIELDRGIDSGDVHHNPLLLLRRHPNDPPSRWEHVVKKTRNVVWNNPWEARSSIHQVNITEQDISLLTSTLKHSNIHINVSSTMTIDGAIFDKPQIGPAYDPRQRPIYARVMKENYMREHYIPIAQSGGLRIANSYKNMISAINEGFEDPKLYHKERKFMVEEICTFVDGKSTDRVADAILAFCRSKGL